MSHSSKTTKVATPEEASVDGSLRWLIGIFLLCVALIFGLRGYFDHLETEVKRRGDNERARLFVGEEIVRGIREIEKDIYRMAVTQNTAGFIRINKEIEAHLVKLKHDLNVLKDGGTSQREMRLYIDGTDAITREATYRPNPDHQSVIMELIEIEPQLSQIRVRARQLEELLARRWQTLEAQDASAFLLVEEERAPLPRC